MKILAMSMLVMTITSAIVGAQCTYLDDDDDDHEIGLPEVIRPGYEAARELIPGWTSKGTRGRIPVNVDSFGAVGDGATDDTQVNTNSIVPLAFHYFV